jgi:ABC-type multidrug transport system fused ATPase/permease subunit
MKVSSDSSPRYSALLYLLSRYKLAYGLILLVVLAVAAMETLSVAAFFPLFSSVLTDSPNEKGGILGIIVAVGKLLPILNPTAAAAVILVVMFVMKSLLSWLQDVLMTRKATEVQYRVKKQMIERYASAHYQYHLDSQQGTMIYNLLTASLSVQGILITGVNIVAALVKMLALAALLVSMLPAAALAMGVLSAMYFWGIHYLSQRVSYRLGARSARAEVEQTVIANEFLSGFRQIITCRAARRWLERFDQQNSTYRDLVRKEQIWSATPRHVIEVSALALMLGLIMLFRVSNPDIFVSEGLPILGVFGVALVRLLPGLTALHRQWSSVMGGLPNLERVHQLLTGPIAMRKDGSRTLESFEKALSFEDVSFAYNEREPLFNGLNLTFEKGKVTAIVGPSGAGKTSIVNLILGLFEPTQGRITIDGVPLQEFRQESWLEKIGFVSQDLFMYHASIADNIRLDRNGHPFEATSNAAKIANAHGFISALPQGYDTVVGDRGMTLSGGQQQRLAIARAMLETPEILIFDEATSSLDTISEKQVQDAIDQVATDRTVIIIAHRLSTIRHADQIVVIDNGQVIEAGSHQELLTSNGHYSRLVAAQR